MPIIHLEDLDDPRLAAYSGMTDAQLRDCPDSTHGLFIGESRKVIERALAAGVRMRSLQHSHSARWPRSSARPCLAWRICWRARAEWLCWRT